MPRKEDRLLRVGVLGAGQIAQAAHFESCTKARNAELFAICDVADDLRERMAVAHGAKKTFNDYDAMLADPDVEAVIIATADAFHVPASIRALQAGKHVLCEKPVALGIEEAEGLRAAVKASGKVFQIGHMLRFDPGIESAKAFIRDEMGTLVALKAWYCDSTHRYTMTDAIQPTIAASAQARKPAGNPKANLFRYNIIGHGCHLFDLARFLGGPLKSLRARYAERGGMHCWLAEVGFESGALGQLDLTLAIRADWHEGFTVYGERGSVFAKTYNPWYYKSSDVEIFREADGATHRVLGADGHFYRRQLEGFADTVLHGKPMRGADIEDGIASVQAMVAFARSSETGKEVLLSETAGLV